MQTRHSICWGASHRRRRCAHPGSTLAVALLGLLLLSPSSAFGAGEAPAFGGGTPETVATPTPTGPVDLGALLAQIESTRATLRKAETVSAPSDKVERIQDALPDLTLKVRTSGLDAERLLATAPPVEVLDDLSASWKTFQETLSAWNTILAARVQELDLQVRALKDLDERWQQIEKEAGAADAPGPTRAQIRELRSAITQTRTQVQKARDRILTLQAMLAEPSQRVVSILDAAREARSERVDKLLVRDRPPLWSRSIRDQRLRDLPVEFRATLSDDLDAATTYLRARRTQVALEALGLLALAWVLARARKRITDPEVGDARLKTIGAVLERPLSAAFLLGAPLFLLLHPSPPPRLGALVGSLALIPTLRTLFLLFGPGLRPALYALAGFFLVDQLRHAAMGLPLVPRALFSLEMSAGTVVLLWVLRPSRLEALPPTAGRESRFRWASRGLRVLLAAFVIGLVASVLGYMQLAVVVGGSSLQSAYLAAIVYAVVRTGQALVAYLLRSPTLSHLRIVRRHRQLLDRRICRAIRSVGTLAWVLGVSELFSLREGLVEMTMRALSSQLVVGNLSLSLGDVLLFVATVWSSFLVSRFARFILEEEVYHRLPLRRGVPYALSALVHYAILLLGFLLAVLASGVDLDRFALMAGAFGVGIGFGMQNVVSNFVSGLILLFERPVQVSDTVQLGDLMGEVQRIGIRSSTVRTWEGAEVIVPNTSLVSTEVTNWTLSDRLRRIDLPVGVAYGSDPDRVIGILKSATESSPSVLDDPPIDVLFIGFGDSSLDFQIRAWTSDFKRFPAIRSEIALAVSRALRGAHIEIPFPQRDLHLRSVDLEAGRRLRGGRGGEDSSDA